MSVRVSIPSIKLGLCRAFFVRVVMNVFGRMRENEKLLSQAELKRLLWYQPETGLFLWLKNKNAGRIAGGISHGYVVVGLAISGKHRYYRAHRLAFLWMNGSFPDSVVDHSDRNRSNNAWNNIFESSHIGNSRNRSQQKRQEGNTGVRPVNGKLEARIQINGKRITSTHPTEAAAIAARAALELEHGFSSGHGTLEPPQSKNMRDYIQSSLAQVSDPTGALQELIRYGYLPELTASRVKGIHLDKQSRKYRVHISNGGKRESLGYFKHKHNAVFARYSKELLYGIAQGSDAEAYVKRYFANAQSAKGGIE